MANNSRNVFYKSLQELIDSLAATAVKNSPNADVGKNSPFHDVAIQPPAQEMVILYEQLKNASLNQNPFTADEASLVQLARNENIQRKGATSSSGTVTVSSKVLPSFDIFVPAGTQFSTSGGKIVISTAPALLPALSDIQFPNNDPTTSNFFFINENAKSASDTGARYGVDIPVITVSTGSSSKIDIGQINKTLGTPIVGIDEVTNRIPISGGLDQESVFSLQTRITLSKLARQIGADIAYKSKVLNITSIADALVVGKNNPLMKRDVVRGRHIGGSVDVYVIGQDLAQTTQRVQFKSNQTLQNVVRDAIVFENQPVVSINSVIGELDGQFSSSVYDLKKDTSSFIAGSTSAQDSLVFDSDFDARDQIITITYTYNKALKDAKDQVNSSKSINADIAIFEAIQSLVDFSITVRAKKGVSKGVAEQEIINTVSDYLSSFALGQELKVSEVISLIQNISLVDEVITKSTTFGKRSGNTAQRNLPSEPINISFTEKNLNANEYLRLGSVTVVVLENN